jgi:hypothetical protein
MMEFIVKKNVYYYFIFTAFHDLIKFLKRKILLFSVYRLYIICFFRFIFAVRCRLISYLTNFFINFLISGVKQNLSYRIIKMCVKFSICNIIGMYVEHPSKYYIVRIWRSIYKNRFYKIHDKIIVRMNYNKICIINLSTLNIIFNGRWILKI